MKNTGTKTTKTQACYLAALAQVWDAANAANLENWGEGLAGGINEARIAHELGLSYVIPTGNALSRAGLIEINVTEISSSELRRGSWGSWNGARRTVQVSRTVSRTVKITAAGRAAVTAKESL